jgi:hypothetical protein
MTGIYDPARGETAAHGKTCGSAPVAGAMPAGGAMAVGAMAATLESIRNTLYSVIAQFALHFGLICR